MRDPVTLTQPKRQTPIVSDDPNRLPINARTRVPKAFVFVHYDDWEFDLEFGHGWLPSLCKIIAEPGCNGVPRNGDLAGVLQAVVQRGGTVVQPTDRRLIEKGANEDSSEWYHYPRYFETQGRHPQKYWVEPGQSPTVTRSGEVLWDMNKIRETSARFRAHLRDSGIVAAMHPLTLEAEILKAQASADRLASRVGGNPHLVATLKSAKDQIVKMRTSFEAMQTAAVDNGHQIEAKPNRPKAITPKLKRGEP